MFNKSMYNLNDHSLYVCDILSYVHVCVYSLIMGGYVWGGWTMHE